MDRNRHADLLRVTERTAAALSRHYATGRLTLEEFQERLDKAYAAKTVGELGALMRDLPEADIGQLPGAPGGNPTLPQPRAPGQVQVPGHGRPAVPRFWLAVAIFGFVLWLMSGASGGLWFLWFVVPLVLIMLTRWALGAERRTRDRHQ
jgi:Domain of unknown function (DUF1707)